MGEAEPLALSMTLDDKFALLPRALASVYMNATRIFDSCQARERNAPDCGGGRAGGADRMLAAGKVGRAGKAGAGGKVAKHQRKLHMLNGRRLSDGGGGRGVPRSKTISKAKMIAAKSHSGSGRPPPPYWATPQCVLKRHLLATVADVHMVDCLRREGEPALLRLIRTVSGHPMG